jgi:hypothetical protein
MPGCTTSTSACQKKMFDVYYFAPDGTKLRSGPEVDAYAAGE